MPDGFQPVGRLIELRMATTLLTLDQFCGTLPEWYDASTRNEYRDGWVELIGRLPEKAGRLGYFDMRDLSDIAEWGGNQHGVKQRLQSSNTPDDVRHATSLALRHIDDPAQAMREVARLKNWGVSYGSKTLTLMCPSQYGILDSRIRKALVHVIPEITDGSTGSVVRGYVGYLGCCRALQRKVAAPPPLATTDGRWRIADIGQGLFEFARSGGVVVPPATHAVVVMDAG